MEPLQKSQDNNDNQIDLSIMLLPEAVRIVRLTVSGIASTIGFQIDEIEDIKVAVAEICNRIIIQCNSVTQRCVIKFIMSSEELKVRFEFEDHKPDDFKLFDDDDVFGIAIVNSLMDDVMLENNSEGKGIISFSMHLKENEI